MKVSASFFKKSNIRKKYIPPKCSVKNLPVLSDIKKHEICPNFPGGIQKASNLVLSNGRTIGVTYYKKEKFIDPLDRMFLPKSWLTTDIKGKEVVKPYLYIDLIQINDKQQGLGYGRELLKQLYQESINMGCEGRMAAKTAWHSYGFYAKTGWETYFDLGRRINRAKRKVNIFTGIKNQISKYKKTPIIDKIINHYNKLLEKLEAKMPYKNEDIIFNPTEENINKLFGR